MNSGRDHRFVENELELLAEFGVIRPLPLHLDDFPGHGSHEAPDHANEVLPTWNFHPGDSEATLFAGIGNPLDLALKFGQRAIMLLPCWFDWHPLYFRKGGMQEQSLQATGRPQ